MEKIKETIRRFISKKDYDRVNHLLLVNESLEEDYKLAISALIDSRTGNHANAKTKYEKSLAIKDSPAVHLNYATFLFETGEHECA
jgi:Tfp pilus assembly protein PilF